MTTPAPAPSPGNTAPGNTAPGNTAPGNTVPGQKAPGPIADGHGWRAVSIVLVGAFMALLDTTIVNVALPSIGTGLHASSASLEWIVSGYALAYGLALVPGGRAGDRFGHKRLFLIGLVIFTLASVACGVSADSGRDRRGPDRAGPRRWTVLPLDQRDDPALRSPGPARSKAFGVLGAVIGVSTAMGPLLGGLIIGGVGPADGWRWVFLVNLFIGAVAIPMAAWRLPRAETRHQARLRPDRPGTAHRRPAPAADSAGRGPAGRLARLDLDLLRRLRRGRSRCWPRGSCAPDARRRSAAQAGPAAADLLLGRRCLRDRVLRRLQQHLLHAVDPVAGGPGRTRRSITGVRHRAVLGRHPGGRGQQRQAVRPARPARPGAGLLAAADRPRARGTRHSPDGPGRERLGPRRPAAASRPRHRHDHRAEPGLRARHRSPPGGRHRGWHPRHLAAGRHRSRHRDHRHRAVRQPEVPAGPARGRQRVRAQRSSWPCWPTSGS